MIKILIAGTGSIATRHAKNLISIGLSITIFTNRKVIPEEQIIKGVNYTNNFDKALDECDAVIIANRTDLHIHYAIKAARKKKNLFIEKPLSHNLEGIDLLEKYLKEKSLFSAPGFMLRYHPNIIFIKKYLEENKLGKIHYARALVGQYLPDWRPGSDYKNGYGAKKKFGGGVILDLIHEIDLALHLFGDLTYVKCLKSYTKDLEIETESIASISYYSKNEIMVNIILDYVRPVLGRNLEIVGENEILLWDFVRGEVLMQSKKETTFKIIHKVDKDFTRNQMYLDEIKAFLKIIDDKTSANERDHLKLRNGSISDAIKALKFAISCHSDSDKISK